MAYFLKFIFRYKNVFFFFGNFYYIDHKFFKRNEIFIPQEQLTYSIYLNSLFNKNINWNTYYLFSIYFLKTISTFMINSNKLFSSTIDPKVKIIRFRYSKLFGSWDYNDHINYKATVGERSGTRSILCNRQLKSGPLETGQAEGKAKNGRGRWKTARKPTTKDQLRTLSIRTDVRVWEGHPKNG